MQPRKLVHGGNKRKVLSGQWNGLDGGMPQVDTLLFAITKPAPFAPHMIRSKARGLKCAKRKSFLSFSEALWKPARDARCNERDAVCVIGLL